MTFVEFEQLPDAPGKPELIDGELIESLPPVIRYSQIARRFHHLLFKRLPEFQVWHETGYRIADGWLQLDVSVAWPKSA